MKMENGNGKSCKCAEISACCKTTSTGMLGCNEIKQIAWLCPGYLPFESLSASGKVFPPHPLTNPTTYK